MNQIEATIVNELGLHLRAAGVFVQEAAKYASEIWLVRGNMRANGKSIMGVLSMAAARGTVLTIQAEGPDEELAITRLAEVIAGGFAE